MAVVTKTCYQSDKYSKINIFVLFATLGAVIICVDRNTETCEETATMIKEKRGLAYAYTVDVTQRLEIEEFHRKVCFNPDNAKMRILAHLTA